MFVAFHTRCFSITIRRPNIGRKKYFFRIFLEISGSIFGSWVKKYSILELGFGFSMKDFIYSQLEMSVGPNFDPNMSKIQKLGPNFGRRYVWATDRTVRQHDKKGSIFTQGLECS